MRDVWCVLCAVAPGVYSGGGGGVACYIPFASGGVFLHDQRQKHLQKLLVVLTGSKYTSYRPRLIPVVDCMCVLVDG